MLQTRRLSLSFALSALLLDLCGPAFAASKTQPDHWVGTWATAPMAARNATPQTTDTTYREIVHVSIGGPLIRIVFTNEFGTEPLIIGAAHAALSAGSGDIALTSANALTFGGSPTITIPAGGMAVSDPAALTLKPFDNLAVSLFIPAQTISQISAHSYANQTSYTASGNVVSAKTLTQPTPIYSWPFLKGIDVLVGPESSSIVAFGDSITDGAASTRDANTRWPDLLAQRLHGSRKTSSLGVLNEGIGGNRVLHNDTGPDALARFDRDVLAQAGVKYVILMEGINDIGNATSPRDARDPVTAQDIILGLGQLAARAHTRGIKAIGATLTPYVGAGYQSPEGEAMRIAVNDWIRTTHDLDGVIDFDKATRDSANPAVLGAASDSGDHLHPNDAGYKNMANAIDISLFLEKK